MSPALKDFPHGAAINERDPRYCARSSPVPIFGRNRDFRFSIRDWRSYGIAAAFCVLSLLMALSAMLLDGCSNRELNRSVVKDAALAERINGLVEAFITSGDDARETQVLAEAKAIFERGGIPSMAEVGDAASYGFVLVNMLGQTPKVRTEFIEKLREAGARRELPPDAVVFAEARFRQTGNRRADFESASI